jgi:hypothetical protein
MYVKLKSEPVEIPAFVETSRCERLEDLDTDVAIIGIPCKSYYEVSVPLGTMVHAGQIG